jgi:hypothetical protein
MATALLFNVRFRIVNVASPGPGKDKSPYNYTRESRWALVQAASIHPKDLLATLNNDIALSAGETIEILAASQLIGGTEGGSVLT